jgi:peptidoglycan hydrolase FlgJ
MQDIKPATAAAQAARPLPKVDPKNLETAKAFEAVFLGQMTQLMLESVQQEGEFNGGAGEEMFRGVLAEKLGTEMANRGGIGLAPVVLDQILKLQQAK